MKLYHSLLSRLKTQHESIPEILAQTSPERILIHPQPATWSIKDNLAHLARYQQIFMSRIQQILKEENPVLGRYRAEDDPEFKNWRILETDQLLKTLNQEREELIQLISGLKEENLNKVGIHGKFGNLNIVQWTEFFLLHEAHHIYTIFRQVHDSEL